MERSSIDKENKTTDTVKQDQIKRLSELILPEFIKSRKCGIRFDNKYFFTNTEITIDDVKVDISIIERYDSDYYRNPDTIDKLGIFKINKINNDNPLNLKQYEIYKQLETLYYLQESKLEDESKLQTEIKEIIKKAKIIESELEIYSPGSYGNPSLPTFLRDNNCQFNPNNVYLQTFGEQYSILGCNFRYSISATIPPELTVEKHYLYNTTINCNEFDWIENGRHGRRYTLLTSYHSTSIEDAIETLLDTINTYKFFDGILLSPKDLEKATIERQLFPLHENLKCSICLIPTKGITSCNHRICFGCRYKQITSSKDCKRFRCPICRKKNELKRFYEEDEDEEGDYEEDEEDE
jgi:hypothetical protein